MWHLYDEKQTSDIIEQIPDEVFEAMREIDFEQRLVTIGKDHKLRVDQIGTLQDLLYASIAGILAAEKLLPVLRKELRISVQETSALIGDVNKMILQPLQHTIVEVKENNELMLQNDAIASAPSPETLDLETIKAAATTNTEALAREVPKPMPPKEQTTHQAVTVTTYKEGQDPYQEAI